MTLADVAERAGLSRQAIYLHFRDRTDLFLEIAREVDAITRVPELQTKVDEAGSAREALRQSVAVQANIKPRLHALVTAFDILRRSDPDAQAVHEERDGARLARVIEVVQRLADEGQLADGWEVPAAARLAWAVLSQRVWEDLGWDEERYAQEVARFLERALCPAPGT